jgi:CRP-like cAMP-binding protein
MCDINYTYYLSVINMYEKILKSISNNIYLDTDEFDELTSFLKIREIKKGQYLFHRGDIATYNSFVNKGCLKTSFTDSNGQEHIVQFATEGDWITDYDSYINNTPSRLDSIAMEDSVLFQLDRPSLEKLIERIPKFERFNRMVSEHQFNRLQRCLITLLSNNAEERYRDFIQKYPGLANRIPQHQIASFIGITPEYLSRIRWRLAHL